MIWILLFVGLIIFAVIMQGNSNTKNFETNFGFKTSDLIQSGTYVSGHPSLDVSFKSSSIILDKENVKIFEFPPQATGYILKATIEKSFISNVHIEDASTIQNRVTVGRLLLTGVFAFAWKKKTKQECAYLVIEWKYKNFDNETIFEFEGTGSIQRANTLRNRFIKYLSDENIYNVNDSFNINLLNLVNADAKIMAINECVTHKGMTIQEGKNYVDNLINESKET